MWADDNIERNITSSDVEFLAGDELEDKTTRGKTTRKKIPENTRSLIDKARHALMTPDLSGVQPDGDVDMIMGDIMLVLIK